MVVLIFVARGNQRVDCAGENGMTIGDQIRQLIGGLILAYGDQIHVEFMNLDGDAALDDELIEECVKRNYSLPALFIDRQLKFEGGIPIMALKSVLDDLDLRPLEFGESE